MANIKDILNSLKQINLVQHLFFEYQHLFRTEQKRQINAYIKNAQPLYKAVEALESKTISQARAELESFIQSPAFAQMKNDISSLQTMVNQVSNYEFALTHWFPEFSYFPTDMTEEDWKRARADNFANNKVRIQQLLDELERLNNSINALPYTLYTVSFIHGAANGAASTLVTRAIQKIGEHLPASPWIGKTLNVVGSVGAVAALAYDTTATIVAGSTQLATQFVANKLGLKPRTSRQIGTVAAITSITALELYQNPSVDNVLHAATTMAGATVGVVGTDLILDKAGQWIGHGYQTFCGKPYKKPRQTAAYLATQEAEAFTRGIQTRARKAS